MRAGVDCPTTVETLLGAGSHRAATKREVAAALHCFLADTRRFAGRRLNADAPAWAPAPGGAPAAPPGSDSHDVDNDEKLDTMPT